MGAPRASEKEACQPKRGSDSSPAVRRRKPAPKLTGNVKALSNGRPEGSSCQRLPSRVVPGSDTRSGPGHAVTIPTASGRDYYTFRGNDGVLRDKLLECEQVLKDRKKHKHLTIKANPSGERIGYNQLVVGELLGKVYSLSFLCTTSSSHRAHKGLFAKRPSRGARTL